ncbi:hypothetical protein NIA69_06105 [Gemmiger formicilis]|nr:hypothetical protein [Gemmiger formicilis]
MPALTRCSCTNLSRAVTRAWTTAPPRRGFEPAGPGERRAAREPLQYLLGEWDFMDFTLKVGRGVLCPAPTARSSARRPSSC